LIYNLTFSDCLLKNNKNLEINLTKTKNIIENQKDTLYINTINKR